MDENYSLGKRMTKLRTALGLSQEKLAELADLSTEYIGQIEREEKNPTVKTMRKVCGALGVTLSEFFSDAEPCDDSDLLMLQIEALVKPRSDKEKKMILQLIRFLLEAKSDFDSDK